MAAPEDVWLRIERLAAALNRSNAVNVNAEDLRGLARDSAQAWFRQTRPACLDDGIDEAALGELDAAFQYLLRLANGRNAKRSYTDTLKTIKKLRPDLDARVELLRGAIARRRTTGQLSPIESGILATLERMLPGAALCYQQVLSDLSGPVRLSYRGTATELREVVREVLDHLAPDEVVSKSPGFKLEKDRRGPTMKQKARFILKARGLGDSARAAPENSVELLEEQIASLARSIYERGSASTHSATIKAAVLSFKAYADAVLAELLAVHAGA